MLWARIAHDGSRLAGTGIFLGFLRKWGDGFRLDDDYTIPAVSFFGLFGLAAVVIKYLQVLVDLSFKRTQYECSGIERL